MMGARGMVAMLIRDELPAWQRIYVGVADMAGMAKTVIGLAWHDKPMPAR